jgi:hypothetical protein
MYYPQQSPGIAHKLSSAHPDPSPWARPTHPFGPPPPSPGYPLYTNGNMPHHIQSLHHHQNSISHYPSPPSNGGVSVNVLGQTLGVGQGSPGSASSQIITPHWQQQLLKCEVRLCLLTRWSRFTKKYVISSDDPCVSIPPSSRSCQRDGISHRNKVRYSHNKSQQASTRNSNERT